MIKLFGKKEKSRNTLVIDGSEFQAPIKSGQTILDAAISGKIKFPNMCNVGECGTCRCRILKGEVKLKRDITNHVSIDDIKKGYVLACQSMAKGDIVVQVPGLSSTDKSSAKYNGHIEELIKLTHDTYEVRLRLDKPVKYISGQYAQISAPGVESLAGSPRNYSFATPTDKDGTATPVFFIRHVPGGLFTDWLFSADRTNQKVQLNGPYGDFQYHQNQRSILCIAGGSGLAPIKALLQQLKKDDLSPPVTLLFGAREQQDLYCQAEFAELSASWPEKFSFHPVLSDENEDSNWQGLRGFVTEHMESLVPDLAERDAYLCGPPVMLDAAISQLEKQIPVDRIHFDKFLDQSFIQQGERDE